MNGCSDNQNCTNQLSNENSEENFETNGLRSRNDNLSSKKCSRKTLNEWDVNMSSYSDNNNDTHSLAAAANSSEKDFYHTGENYSNNGASCNKHCFTHNNLVEERNLPDSNDKSCYLYMKYPLKVNNSNYPDKAGVVKDGMEEYFKSYSPESHHNTEISEAMPNLSPPINCANNGIENGDIYYDQSFADNTGLNDSSYLDQSSSDNGLVNDGSTSYHDQNDVLNGDEENEDDETCFYTYKGDHLENNLLQTCFSCGLPTSGTSSQNGALSIQQILNGTTPSTNPVNEVHSPEMDFLEMDFDDHGSNGDFAESGSEDNNVACNVDYFRRTQNNIGSFENTDSPSENFPFVTSCNLMESRRLKLDNSSSNLRSLMCRRCELSMYNDRKVNNVNSGKNDMQKIKNLHQEVSTEPSCSSNMQQENARPSFDFTLRKQVAARPSCENNLHQEVSEKPSCESNLQEDLVNSKPPFSRNSQKQINTTNSFVSNLSDRITGKFSGSNLQQAINTGPPLDRNSHALSKSTASYVSNLNHEINPTTSYDSTSHPKTKTRSLFDSNLHALSDDTPVLVKPGASKEEHFFPQVLNFNFDKPYSNCDTNPCVKIHSGKSNLENNLNSFQSNKSKTYYNGVDKTQCYSKIRQHYDKKEERCNEIQKSYEEKEQNYDENEQNHDDSKKERNCPEKQESYNENFHGNQVYIKNSLPSQNYSSIAFKNKIYKDNIATGGQSFERNICHKNIYENNIENPENVPIREAISIVKNSKISDKKYSEFDPNKKEDHIKLHCYNGDKNILEKSCLSNFSKYYPSSSSSDAHTTNHPNSFNVNNCQNNNLGSISAPEVSPSKEYIPLDNFPRSVSFHNQLSSPKYENNCHFPPYKENVASSLRKHKKLGMKSYSNCTHNSTSNNSFDYADISNLEACADRLSQRERSVFNVTDSSVSTSENISNVAILPSISDQEKEKNSFDPSSFKVLHPKIPLFPDFRDPAENGENLDNIDKEDENKIEKVMIWTEKQATHRQVSQIATSACGPTAVINVLLALGHSKPIQEVTACIKARIRAEKSPIVQYILSRSNAGTTHQNLISGIEKFTENQVRGRFFSMFPKRVFQLSRWLSSWINKGGVPVATLNLQVGVTPGQTIPDAWHHQMVFGVGPQGIYLTNPLECISDSLLSDQLCSDSILLVRRSDVTSRWDKKDELIQLSLQADPRWNEMNVLGQIVCVLKEEAAPEMIQGRRHMTSHVAIPAAYQSGVAIFMRSDNEALEDLLQAPELPLLD